MNSKINYDLKRYFLTTEQQTVQGFPSLYQVRNFWHCLGLRSGLTQRMWQFRVGLHKISMLSSSQYSKIMLQRIIWEYNNCWLIQEKWKQYTHTICQYGIKSVWWSLTAVNVQTWPRLQCPKSFTEKVGNSNEGDRDQKNWNLSY